jgi:hypothetical protein
MKQRFVAVTISMIKSRRMRWAGYVACLFVKPRGPGIDGRIIVGGVMEKWFRRARAGLI